VIRKVVLEIRKTAAVRVRINLKKTLFSRLFSLSRMSVLSSFRLFFSLPETLLRESEKRSFSNSKCARNTFLKFVKKISSGSGKKNPA
jgi:hypothetical protein